MQSTLRGAIALTCALVAIVPALAVAPPPPVDSARVALLVKKLDADAFRTRQTADLKLRALGQAALPFVREELARTRSFEVRHRLQLIEQHLTSDANVSDLVKLLGHSDKKLHQHADRTLRNAGASVLPLLHKEVNGNLPTDHRKRLEKLINDLSATAHR